MKTVFALLVVVLGLGMTVVYVIAEDTKATCPAGTSEVYVQGGIQCARPGYMKETR